MSAEELMRLKQNKHDKRRYLKVRPIEGGPWAVISPHELDSMLDGEELETFETIEVWMSPDEYDALAEFTGW